MMDELKLFTDGRVDTQSNIGYGAYLVVSQHGLSLVDKASRHALRRDNR
jgi:hypothetical protein